MKHGLMFMQDKSQRSLDLETATEMLKLLLGKRWALYSQFQQFLQVNYSPFTNCTAV